MMSSAYARLRGRMVGDLPLLALGASITAWVALFAATGSEAGARLYGSSMMPGSTIDSTLEFLGAWEAMVIAMMLPSSLGFLMLFRTATGGARFRATRRAAVCLGYALVWAGVGCFAIFISEALHRVGGLGVWMESHFELPRRERAGARRLLSVHNPEARMPHRMQPPGEFLLAPLPPRRGQRPHARRTVWPRLPRLLLGVDDSPGNRGRWQPLHNGDADGDHVRGARAGLGESVRGDRGANLHRAGCVDRRLTHGGACIRTKCGTVGRHGIPADIEPSRAPLRPFTGTLVDLPKGVW